MTGAGCILRDIVVSDSVVVSHEGLGTLRNRKREASISVSRFLTVRERIQRQDEIRKQKETFITEQKHTFRRVWAFRQRVNLDGSEAKARV